MRPGRRDRRGYKDTVISSVCVCVQYEEKKSYRFDWLRVRERDAYILSGRRYHSNYN